MTPEKGPKPLSALFERYKKTLQAPEASVVTAFCEIVRDVLQIELTETQVSYQKQQRLLALKVAGPVKNEIMMHKTDLLRHCKGRLGVDNAPKNII